MIGFMGLQVEEIIYQGNYYGEYFSAGDESATETNSKDIKMFYGKEDHFSKYTWIMILQEELILCHENKSLRNINHRFEDKFLHVKMRRTLELRFL